MKPDMNIDGRTLFRSMLLGTRGVLALAKGAELAELTLSKEIADEEDGDTCIVLGSSKAKILVQTIQLAIDHGITVQEIEEVHDPEGRL